VSPLFASVFTVALLSSIGAAGQSKLGSIQGVWRFVEMTITGPGDRTIGSPSPTKTSNGIICKVETSVFVCIDSLLPGG
jgi:hypothetical protein